MINVNEIIKKILFLPREFYNKGNASIYSLLKDTGYFELHDQIRLADILNSLQKWPEASVDWLTWSENKRTDSGWFIVRKDLAKYIVGKLKSGIKEDISEYSDANMAFAKFISEEIESIRRMDPN